MPPNEPTERISGTAWRALAAGAAGYVLFGFNSTATNLAFDAIQTEFSTASEATVGWVASGFFVASAAFLPLGGRLADRHGRRRIFVIGMAIFAVAAVLSWAAPNVWSLIGARVIQAIGSALLIPASLSMVLPLFPSTRRGTAVSTWAAAGPLSAALAPSTAAFLLDTTSWRWVYFISGPIAVAILLAALASAPESKGEEATEGGRLDYAGTVMLTSAIALLVVGISQGRVWGWTSLATGAVVALSFALLIVFVIRSAEHPTPLLNVSLFRIPEVSVANTANLFMSITSLSIWLIWPLWLKRVWDYPTAQIGLAITIGPLFAGPASIIAGRLADKYGPRWPMVIGSGLATLAVTYTVFSFSPEPDYWLDLAPAIALFGTGWGISHPQMNSWALSKVPADYYGETNATFNTLRNVGAVVGTAGAVAIVGAEDRTDVLAAYDRANIFFAVWVGLSFLTVLIGTAVLEGRHRRDLTS